MERPVADVSRRIGRTLLLNPRDVQQHLGNMLPAKYSGRTAGQALRDRCISAASIPPINLLFKPRSLAIAHLSSRVFYLFYPFDLLFMTHSLHRPCMSYHHQRPASPDRARKKSPVYGSMACKMQGCQYSSGPVTAGPSSAALACWASPEWAAPSVRSLLCRF